MLFNSYPFLFLFLPLTVAGFYALRRTRIEWPALLYVITCSVAFYAYWKVAYVPLLLGSVIANYALGSLVLRGNAAGKRRLAKAAMVVGVAANVLALGYFKYANFFVLQAESLTGADFGFGTIVLPLAISFYTFQQIAYLVDCYRGKMRNNSLLRYVFVVTFFPHLIAGPIVRFSEIGPQFSQFLTRSAALNIAVGLAVFVLGLGKKVLIADYFGGIATPLFVEAHELGHIGCLAAWVAALSYTLQLYFDFSGYSDMAIGLSRMFGFRLAVNFLSPYKSVSIADFWRRWHITLSRFLRDYLYIALGGNRKGLTRTYINLLLTMTIGGLWHGAAWTFVVWGLYHGTLLAMHRGWRAYGAPIRAMIGEIPTPFAVGATFLSVVVGWVVFRSPDFTTAGTVLAALPRLSDLREGSLGFEQQTLLAIAAGLLACWLLPNVYQIFHHYRPALILVPQFGLVRPRPTLLQWRFSAAEAATLSVVLLGSVYMMRAKVSEFLYFMF